MSFDSCERRPALRRAELDAVGACVPELEDALGDLLRRARDAEALERRRLARLERERRVEMCDDAKVRLDCDARSFASPVSVLVDDGDRTDDDPHIRVVEPAARNGDEVGICAAAELQLVRDRSRPACRLRPPRPDHERHGVALARIRERRSRLEREALSREAGLVAREQRGDDSDRFAERGERPLLLDAELVEPRPFREAEVRTSPRDRVEHGDLAGDLVRMQRERVERCRPESDPLGHPSHEQERPDRRLVEEVVVDREDVDAARLGPPRERFVLLRRLVRANADAELAGYVSSSVTSVRSPIRSMRMTRRSSGSGQATSESCSSQSSSGSLPHLRGEQRQHGLDGEEAEVLALRDADAARLGHLEEVAHLEPADRATLDALDGHAQVVEPHFGHNGYHTHR